MQQVQSVLWLDPVGMQCKRVGVLGTGFHETFTFNNCVYYFVVMTCNIFKAILLKAAI